MDLSCLMQGHTMYQNFVEHGQFVECTSVPELVPRLESGTSVLNLRGHLLCSNGSVTYEELKTRPKCNTQNNGMN